jgi:hypothetical protein
VWRHLNPNSGVKSSDEGVAIFSHKKILWRFCLKIIRKRAAAFSYDKKEAPVRLS